MAIHPSCHSIGGQSPKVFVLTRIVEPNKVRKARNLEFYSAVEVLASVNLCESTSWDLTIEPIGSLVELFTECLMRRVLTVIKGQQHVPIA